jgi:hypothetical protein
MKIFIGYFNAEMGTENILKPTIMNKSLYEMTIDNGN